MNRQYLALLMVGFVLIMISPAIGYQVSAENTTTTITYSFEPWIQENDTLWFDGALVERPVSNLLHITSLSPSQSYELLIDSDTYGLIRHVETTAYDPFSTDTLFRTWFWLVFGLLLMALTARLPLAGYASMMVLLIGVFFVLKYEINALVILAYVVSFFGSVIMVTNRN